MPYAAYMQISQDPIPGGIEITEAQYLQALQAMMDGKIVSIEGGFHIVDPSSNPSPPTPNPPLPDLPYVIAVSNLWLAMSDEEAEAFDAAMATASPLRLRRAFNTASTLTSETELFKFVKGVLVASIGAPRAEAILATAAASAIMQSPVDVAG